MLRDLIDVGLWLGGEKGLVTYFYLIAGRVRDLQERRSVLQKSTTPPHMERLPIPKG